MDTELCLVAGDAPTVWAEPVLDLQLASAAGIPALWMAIRVDGGWPEACRPEGAEADPRDPVRRDAAHQIQVACAALADVRSDDGTLLGVQSQVPAALASAAFRGALLARLGAREGIAAVAVGGPLLARDAWGSDRAADVAALTAAVPGGWVLRFDQQGVHSVHSAGEEVTTEKGRQPFRPAPTGAVDREQVVFARSLLALLAGLGLAIVFAGWLQLR